MKLLPHQLSVQTISSKKLIVITPLHNLSVVNNSNHIGVPHSRQPMRNNDHRHVHTRIVLMRHEQIDSLVHQMLRLTVQRSRRLVQQQHLRLPHQCPCDCDGLLLSPRQCDPPLPNFVSYPSGSKSMKVCAFASFAAWIIWSCVTALSFSKP